MLRTLELNIVVIIRRQLEEYHTAHNKKHVRRANRKLLQPNQDSHCLTQWNTNITKILKTTINYIPAIWGFAEAGSLEKIFSTNVATSRT